MLTRCKLCTCIYMHMHWCSDIAATVLYDDQLVSSVFYRVYSLFTNVYRLKKVHVRVLECTVTVPPRHTDMVSEPWWSQHRWSRRCWSCFYGSRRCWRYYKAQKRSLYPLTVWKKSECEKTWKTRREFFEGSYSTNYHVICCRVWVD